MNTLQITLRNVPEPVVRQLKKRASISGNSFNSEAVKKLSEGMIADGNTVGQALQGWFDKGGIDDVTMRAIEEHREEQKVLAERELKKIEDLGF